MSERVHRRVQRPGAPGSDPEPKREQDDDPEQDGEARDTNDTRLRQDRPPHWG